MTLKVNNAGGDFEKCPVGVHAAWCVSVIDLGTQISELYGSKRKVWILFEIPDKKMSDGRPFGVSVFYTASLNEKANLRHDLEAWRGKPFTKQELESFDLKNIVGKPCLLNIIHNEKDKVEIASIMPLPKTMPIAAMVNETCVFDIADDINTSNFEKIPAGIQKIIKSSEEFTHTESTCLPGTTAQPAIDGEIVF